jgi:hypothetical protein
MRTVTILGLGALGVMFALPAQALTISNTDPKAHTITVKAGSDSTKLTIEPAAAVEPACQSGCSIVLENGDIYEMKGGEIASIESGALFVDAVPGGANNEMTGATPSQAQ